MIRQCGPGDFDSLFNDSLIGKMFAVIVTSTVQQRERSDWRK